MNKKIKRIILLVITLSLLLFTLELITRISTYNDYKTYPSYYELNKSALNILEKSSTQPFTLKKNSQGTHYDPRFLEYNYTIKTNSLGYRNEEFKSEKPDNKYRIIILGDSFTFGYGIKDNKTYTKILQDLLNNITAQYQVINAGYKAGYSPDSYYSYLNNEGYNLKPDMIILAYYPGNDVTDISENIWQELDDKELPLIVKSKTKYVDENGVLRTLESNKTKQKSIYHSIDYLLRRNFYTYIFLKHKISNIIKQKSITVYETEYWTGKQKELELTKEIITEIKKETQKRHIKLVIVLIPSKEQIGTENIGNRHLPQEKIITLTNITPSIDLYYDFLNKELFYFEKDGHWNEYGQEYAAKIIYKHLVEEKLL